MENPEESVKSHTGHNQSFTSSNMVTTTGSETVGDRNYSDGCQDQKQKEDVEKDLMPGKHSDISIRCHENLTGDGVAQCPHGNDKEQITVTAPNIMTTFNNEQDHIDEKVLRKEKKESLNQENEGSGGKTTTASTDLNCKGPDVTSGSVCIDTSDNNKQSVSSHLESCLQPDGSTTNIDFCVEKEWTSPSEKENTTSSTDPECSSPVVISDSNEQSVSYSLESCLQSNNSSRDMNPSLKKECPAENTDGTYSPAQQQLLNQTPPGTLEPQGLGDVAENARESFEEFDTSVEGQPDKLYGEPLSREDSSCDTDEARLVTCKSKELFMARRDKNSVEHSEGQIPQLQCSTEMRNYLQPVVILKTLESENGMSNSYRCRYCQHITHNVNSLIEHHHSCRSVHNFQFCKTCNLYLMRSEQAEKHVCDVTKESLQLPSNCSLQKKRKRHGRHRCIKCKLIFSKLVQYIRHMRTHTGKTPFKCNECGLYFAQAGTLHRHKRIPGRCKPEKLLVTNSDANKPYANLTKTEDNKDNLKSTEANSSLVLSCQFCGKYFKLIQHRSSHLKRGKLQCPDCDQQFQYPVYLLRHLDSHKNRENKASELEESAPSKPRTTLESAKEQIGPKQLQCSLCKEVFDDAQVLRKHCLTHISGSSSNQCPFCKHNFTKNTPSLLMDHKCCPTMLLSGLVSGILSHIKESNPGF
uniref:C2H2-type domain-containing protein n=1 Tax=Seriola lalandi dorsalis TaxID=1841481 RepID=A0A3B4Y9U0_SERLL